MPFTKPHSRILVVSDNLVPPAHFESGSASVQRDRYRHFDTEWHPCFQRGGVGYYSDLCFQFAHILPPRTEKKFRLGIFSWLIWFFGISLWRRGQDRPKSTRASLVISGISTTAHEETAATFAIASGVNRKSIRVFAPSECPESLQRVSALPPLDLAGIRQSLKKLEKLRALSRAVSIILRIRRVTRETPAVHSAVCACLPSILDALACLEGTRIALQGQIKPETLHVLTYELQAEMKAFATACRDHNARIVHIMHGQRLATYQVTQATDLVLFSKIDEPWFRQRVDPSVRIWTVGHPRIEAVRSAVGTPHPGNNGDLPKIAFFSQPAEGVYTRQDRIEDWKILSSLAGRAAVRMRLHPRESKEEALLDLESLGLDFIELSEAGLIEDLKWCDAVASSWSTVSMEAAACGRGIFWTCATPERYEASQELRAHGVGVLIDQPGKWESFLCHWHEQGAWEAPVLVPDDRLRELGMIGDMKRSWLERLRVDGNMGLSRPL